MCVCDVCALKAKQLTLTRCEVRRKNDRKDKREKKICVCVVLVAEEFVLLVWIYSFC